MKRVAIDLGSTNTVAAMCEESGGAHLLHLPHLSRQQPEERSYLIPSALCIQETVIKRFFFRQYQRRICAGQMALDQNLDGQSPYYAQGFKRHLGGDSLRPSIRLSKETITARETARLFLGEILRAIRSEVGETIRDLVMPSPVGFYETYRAELSEIARSLGIRRFRSLDEPVAAAIGYGVNVARDENLLVVDFGGGTLNLAVVRLGHEATAGNARTLAKHMVQLGGDDVDRWLVEEIAPSPIRDLPEWRRDLIWEAMRAKETASRDGQAEFRWGGIQPRIIDRAMLVVLLDRRGLYDQLRRALDEIAKQMEESGEGGIDEILLTGGSTLLPEVAAVIDARFPKAIARHDPDLLFTGVALGAARFAGGVPVEDHIYHDYAVTIRNPDANDIGYELIVPRRTRYPTASNFAERYYAEFPGMKEMRFTVCEIGRLGQAPAPWSAGANGSRYWTPKSDGERATVAEVNPGDDPVSLHPPGRTNDARLRVTYGVNADRWLCVTIDDLVSRQTLRENEPVVRLR